MRKIKIYLDATIPNYVFNRHTPEKQKAAVQLFSAIKRGNFDAYISKIVIDELIAAPEHKKIKMVKLVKDISVIELTEECNALAETYINRGVIPTKNKDDALHIAIATIYGLDALVSYNFEHIVKLKTLREVSGINISKGYKIIDLVIPEEVLNE